MVQNDFEFETDFLFSPYIENRIAQKYGLGSASSSGTSVDLETGTTYLSFSTDYGRVECSVRIKRIPKSDLYHVTVYNIRTFKSRR